MWFASLLFAATLKACTRSLANCPFNLLQAEEESVAQIKHPLGAQRSCQTQNAGRRSQDADWFGPG